MTVGRVGFEQTRRRDRDKLTSTDPASDTPYEEARTFVGDSRENITASPRALFHRLPASIKRGLLPVRLYFTFSIVDDRRCLRSSALEWIFPEQSDLEARQLLKLTLQLPKRSERCTFKDLNNFPSNIQMKACIGISISLDFNVSEWKFYGAIVGSSSQSAGVYTRRNFYK